MAELIAGIIAYNEEQLLPRCLDSLVGKVDRIILVEGRIATYPGDGVRSTDNTLEIAASYGCEIITHDEPYPDEATMRSQYHVGKYDDWYVLIDADEKCMTPLPKIGDFPANARAYAVDSHMIGIKQSIWRPRIFKHKGEMEFRTIHDALFSDGKLISRPQDTPKLYSVWFAHYQMLRDEIRRTQKRQYYTHGYAHEADYRKEWSMWNIKKDIKR